MKAIINSIQSKNIGIEKIHFENQELTKEVKIVDYFEDLQKGQLVISLYSQIFSDSELKVSIRDSKVIIIVSQLIDFNKSASMYVSDWQTYSPQSYIRMRNISLLLPGDNFYLLRHYVVPEKLLLNIIIGKLLEN